MGIHMSRQSFITDLLNTDADIDWQGFQRSDAQAHAQSHAFGVESLDPSQFTDFDVPGADLPVQDWSAVLASPDEVGPDVGGSEQLVADASGMPVDSSAPAAAGDPIQLPLLPPFIIGTEDPDTLTGTADAEFIFGLGGNDTIDGNGGYDTIYGGYGDDFIHGQGNIDAEYGNDTIYGGDSDNIVDLLRGGDGNDELHGGRGNDGLSGGPGDDILYGDPPAGDPSNPANGYQDQFAFTTGWGHDQVMDFENGIDHFDMSSVLGLLGYSQLTVAASGSDTLISFGNDTILVAGVAPSAIDASDFTFLV
jgi:Ca2+-binding RTX toxin-like protein